MRRANNKDSINSGDDHSRIMPKRKLRVRSGDLIVDKEVDSRLNLSLERRISYADLVEDLWMSESSVNGLRRAIKKLKFDLESTDSKLTVSLQETRIASMVSMNAIAWLKEHYADVDIKAFSDYLTSMKMLHHLSNNTIGGGDCK